MTPRWSAGSRRLPRITMSWRRFRRRRSTRTPSCVRTRGTEPQRAHRDAGWAPPALMLMAHRVGAQHAAPLHVFLPAALCLLAGCSAASTPAPPAADGHLFTLLPSSYTGVRFENRLTDTPDLNVDGLLDIYVCHAGLDPKLRANELYMNQGLDARGVPTFVERAAAYGAADTGYSTQAVFFDYDRDGDLDLFVINNSPRPVASFDLKNTRTVRDPLGGDRLYRNDGGHFVDVSAAAGIYGSEIGLGLGVGVSDLNRDGWPDIYVANDFFERDYLYINKGDGTFAERLEQEMPYISLSSMGLDIADVNNDGWPDVYVVDMLPDDERRLKTTTAFENWHRLQEEVRHDFHYQFTRNMLHLNNGNGSFSDIGQMAGVARTDWSWSPLIADLDLDGYKDIYVTNGLAKDG